MNCPYCNVEIIPNGISYKCKNCYGNPHFLIWHEDYTNYWGDAKSVDFHIYEKYISYFIQYHPNDNLCSIEIEGEKICNIKQDIYSTNDLKDVITKINKIKAFT